MKISEYIQSKIESSNHLDMRHLQYIDEELIIKTCPCCGNEATLVFLTKFDPPCHYISGQIKCTHCRIQTASRCIDGYYGDKSTINDLLDDWNNRTN